MNRPRAVVVLSAIAASTAAFFVVTRWRLAGTLAGAALIPLIYILVTHWLAAALDHVGGWVRSHRLRGGVGSAGRPRSSAGSAAEAVPSPGNQAEPHSRTMTLYRTVDRRYGRTQWLLGVFVLLSFAVSIYALVSAYTGGPAETVIVKDRIVEKLVRVPAEKEGVDPEATTTETSVAGDPGGGSFGAGSSEAGASVTEAPTPTGEIGEPSSSTTTSVGQTDQEGTSLPAPLP